MIKETYTLYNGIQIPKLGLGTWFIPDDQVADAVVSAVELGYRHIDTAQAYGNERGVGDGVRQCGLKREDIFVTTKLAAEMKTYDDAVSAIDQSLETMGLEYIDLMLIHSPQPWADFRGGNYDEGNLAAWKALEEAYKAGKLKAIGVSNFKEEDLKNIMDHCEIKPMVNQLLVHIGNTPFTLIKYCQDHDILVEAYSPVAHGQILDNDQIKNMADQYHVSVAQLCMQYDLQLQTLPLPKTANPLHMKENADLNFTISDEDMEILKNIEPIKDYGEFSHFPVFSGK